MRYFVLILVSESLHGVCNALPKGQCKNKLLENYKKDMKILGVYPPFKKCDRQVLIITK